MVDSQREFMRRCADVAGTAVGEGAFAPGLALWVGTREVAHFDGPDVLDVRLTKAVIRERRSELTNDDRIELRLGTSDWLRVRVKTRSDREHALALVRDAVASNLPTAAPGPPPEGEALARRRRFH
jgi:hypothetical protein